MKYQPSCPDLQVRLQLWQKGRNKINHNSLVVKLRAQCKSTSKNFACNQQDLRLQINLVRLKKKKRSFRTIKWKEEMRNGEEDGEDKKKEVPEVETLHLHSQCWQDTITKRPRGLPWKLERCGCYRKGPRKKNKECCSSRNTAWDSCSLCFEMPCSWQCEGAWRSIRFGTFISSNNASVCWITVR